MNQFTEAFQNMEQEMSGQVTAPETPELESAPETPDAEPKEQPSLYDLDSYKGKIKFKGREFDVSELEKSFLRQRDYTKKTQEIAQERKYIDNLQYDLKAVRGNPNLVDEFKKIYPEKFHAYVDLILEREEKKAETAQEETKPSPIPDELLKKLETVTKKVEQFESEKNERMIVAYEKQIDAIFEQAKAKYKFYDEDKAITRAQLLSSQGVKLDAKAWDKIFKTIDSEYEERLKSYKDTTFKNQASANTQGKEPRAGGGTPSQAPVKPKSMREAHEMFERALQRGEL
jgi:hypothetical protein